MAYGSSFGSPDAVLGFYELKKEGASRHLNATSYIQMMSHTAAVNIGLFFGITGRIIPDLERLHLGQHGHRLCLRGDPLGAGRGDDRRRRRRTGHHRRRRVRHALRHQRPQRPSRDDAAAVRPRPRRAGDRRGRRHPDPRGLRARPRPRRATRWPRSSASAATPTATTSPSRRPGPWRWRCSCRSQDAGLPADAIGFVSGHGTATEWGDLAEAEATSRCSGAKVPIHSLKGHFGHTLGACGAIEAWLGIEMMRDGWFCPTANLTTVDDRCAPLDYVMAAPRCFERRLPDEQQLRLRRHQHVADHQAPAVAWSRSWQFRTISSRRIRRMSPKQNLRMRAYAIVSS